MKRTNRQYLSKELTFKLYTAYILRMICTSVPSIGIMDYSPSFLRFLVVGIISGEFPDSISVIWREFRLVVDVSFLRFVYFVKR